MRRKMQRATRRTQKGITLVLISMVLLILLGVAAFGIDLNHQVLKQNAFTKRGRCCCSRWCSRRR